MLLLATASVTISRQIEDILSEADGHPNSVYSQINKHSSNKALRIFFQAGEKDSDLPVCSPFSVCGKVDTYGTPWMEKQCRCPGTPCSTSTHARDGHTVHDRTKQYKVCEPAKKLKKCKYFRDITWTNIIYPDNSTQQVMHCRCPRNSVAYLVKRHAYQTDSGLGYQFSFACSPQTVSHPALSAFLHVVRPVLTVADRYLFQKLKCQRKEPCRLFSVKKSPSRPDVDEVTMSSLCSCPHNHRCPKHHLDVGVVPGRVYTDDAVRTYSGYCM